MTEERKALREKIEAEVLDYRMALEQEVLEVLGEISPGEKLLIDSICDTERIRREAAANVAERGLRERYSNGRQSVERENKAVEQTHKAAMTAAKLLNTLRSWMRKASAAAGKVSEGVDADELDDY